MNGNTALVSTLLAILAVACGLAWWVWEEIGAVEMSLHGYLALAAGVSLTFLLGIGLMSLVYFSHKHGYDDRPSVDPDF